MKTSMLDKALAVSVVAVTFVALIALWSPRLDGAALARTPEGHFNPTGPVAIDAQGPCAMPPAPSTAPVPSPARRVFSL